jgi:hypothetical protein
MLIKREHGELEPQSVRAHPISFKAAAWDGLLDELPERIVAAQIITRGDVFDIATTSGRTETALLLASFVWGTGKTGYGPARYRKVAAAGEAQLAAAVSAGLDRASQDVIDGYAAFYGGYEPRRRARPFAEPEHRIHQLGPAFFTKLLYFTTDGALILDNVIANAVHRFSRLPYLVTASGESRAWSPYRYAVYLHWMNQTAERLGVPPDLLELAMFRQTPPNDEPDDDGQEDDGPTGRG